MTHFDITVIVNAHREGLLVGPSLRSVQASVAAALDANISIQVIAVLDRSDDVTKNIFDEWQLPNLTVNICHVEYGDLGMSRNYGVSRAQGRWIAFLDADDLWSRNWLTAAFRAAEDEVRLSVWHPETNLCFGVRPHIFMHVDMDTAGFDPSILVETNAWTALSFASRALLTQVPYRATAFDRQIGYEDWGWNLETLSKGAVHKTVAGTAHAIRTKNVSLVSKTTGAFCLPYPPILFRSLLEKRKSVDATVPHLYSDAEAA